MVKFLSDAQYVFAAKPDFSKTEVVKAYDHTIVATDNRRQERGSVGSNEDSVYFQPPACLGQQDLGV
jgi:hypothetical protein